MCEDIGHAWDIWKLDKLERATSSLFDAWNNIPEAEREDICKRYPEFDAALVRVDEPYKL